MQKIPMTPAGYRKLREELDHLLKVERPKNVQDIAEARAHGDLSENAEYHAAKERQGFIEARMRDVEHMIGAAEVIDPAKIRSDTVAFGATVRLLDLQSDDEIEYTIVGPHEGDVKQGLITINSPVAKSLIGREIGDEVTVRAPARTMQYEILDIRFG